MRWKEIFAGKSPEDDQTVFISEETDLDAVQSEENTKAEQTEAAKIEQTAVGSKPAAQKPNAPQSENAPQPAEKSDTGAVTIPLCISGEESIVKAALCLAMSGSIEEERAIKDVLNKKSWRCVATELGGLSGELPLKVSRALVGASLNGGVIRKAPSDMHALMHAAQEAFNSFIPQGILEASIGAKIAIVRNSQWLAVAVSGDAAYHAVSHHVRVGAGVMHL
ncbi:MAG: HutP family protein [Pyramidobacter sp.]|nr:HutP family protein [Pyramidobacter sp.]